MPKSKVYPRVCGGNPLAPDALSKVMGLSPRVRGKPPAGNAELKAKGSIPACAGETAARFWPAGGSRVYPRVCGGNLSLSSRQAPEMGLSPRVRRKRLGLCRQCGREGSIPACAGETFVVLLHIHHDRVYPRVCGGNPGRKIEVYIYRGLSPRVRGKLRYNGAVRRIARSIPACAGETNQPPTRGRAAQVYPRVCGGNAADGGADSSPVGLSPRVRGKLP